MREIDGPVRSLICHGLIFLVIAVFPGCSIQKIAINKLGDALSGTGATFASDDDPDLIGEAIPFSLKLIESLLAESPEHEGLLLAATMGFTQYSYGWVQQRGDELTDDDYEASEYQHDRAKRLYLRASGYGMRALEVNHPGITERLRLDPSAALEKARRDDVPVLYWTAAALGLAVSLSKDDPEVIGELPIVEAMIDRAFELDETFEHGAIHAFLISFEPNRAGVRAGEVETSVRHHFERAVALSKGGLAAPYVALAEVVSMRSQNRVEFEELIDTALAIDADARPEWRLQNLISQRRARWRLSNIDDLFFSKPVNQGDER